MKKRPLGQNFLTDSSIAREIVQRADIRPGERVLEIGPGKGILTQYLLDRADRLTALEIDPKLCDALRRRFGSRENFELFQEDALKFDFSRLGRPFKVVSNLPYYAATHILKRLLLYHDRISDMTVMLQKEVVDRFTARPGQKEYGSLTIFVQYHCRVQRLLDVSKRAFSPPPKIDSSVIRLIPHSRPPVEVEDEHTFFKVVNAAFFHKRKMLKNNLKVWAKQFRRGQNDRMSLADIDLSRRGETLSMEDFARISNYIDTHHG